MDKKIEKMRETLKRRNMAALGAVLLAAALVIIVKRPFVANLASDQQHLDFLQGFVSGLGIAIDFVFLLVIAKNNAAMKDEKKLIRLYNEINDERMMKIEALAGKSAIKISAFAMVFMALIVSFVSIECALAIFAALSVMAIIKVVSRLYYTRTYTGEE